MSHETNYQAQILEASLLPREQLVSLRNHYSIVLSSQINLEKAAHFFRNSGVFLTLADVTLYYQQQLAIYENALNLLDKSS